MAEMFGIDDKNIKDLTRQLRVAKDKAFPFAVKNTINTAAFQTQKLGRRNARSKMIQRNRFTEQSIQVEQTRTLRINRMEGVTGSIAPYMEDQEFGAVKMKTGREGVPIATSYSAGQGQGSQPRTRLPRKANQLQNIKLKRRRGRSPKNRKQGVLFKIQDAVTSGDRIVFLDLGKRQGLFKVVGGKKSFKRGWPPGARLRMLYDLSRESVVIPKNAWLEPAFSRVLRRLPDIHRKSIVFQLNKHGLFKG